MAKKDKKQKKQDKKPKKAVLQLLQQTARVARTALAAQLLGEGLYAGQDQILLALRGSDGMSPGDLAARIGVRPPTITKTIARLQAQGFVSKAASTADARQAVITLTERGEEAAETIRKLAKKSEKAALDGLADKDIKALVKTLAAIEANLQRGSGGLVPETAEDVSDSEGDEDGASD